MRAGAFSTAVLQGFVDVVSQTVLVARGAPLITCVVHCLFVWFGWLVGWWVGGWLVGWLVGWLAGWLLGCLLACLLACLVG